MRSMRILLSQIATFEMQHRAGLNPSCGALSEFFETAREARRELDAVTAGLVPPPAPAAPLSAARHGDELLLEPLGAEEAIRLYADVPVGRVARALLVALGRKDGDPVTMIGLAPRGA
jgi:hypothetical protein